MACGSDGPRPSSLVGYLDSIGFSGAALVAVEGNTLVRAGFGWAERELEVSNQPEGVFRIGSLTKPITSTAILHAVTRGVLSLDDPICTHLHRCPESWRPVRLHHLLAHTSGIPDLFGALPSAPVLETSRAIDTLLARRGEIPLRANPGTEFVYSNFNYMLLGYILETATGVDWESYLRDSILVPAGAADTRYDDAWALVARRVRGYRDLDGSPAPIEYKDHSAYAAGGLLSTVDDLAAWHDALSGGRIIPDSLYRQAVTPRRGDYGYGWQIIEALGRRLYNHSGGLSGFASHLAWYPDDETLVIVLSNHQDTNAKAIACDLARLVFPDVGLPEAAPDYLAQGSAERCAQRSLARDP